MHSPFHPSFNGEIVAPANLPNRANPFSSSAAPSIPGPPQKCQLITTKPIDFAPKSLTDQTAFPIRFDKVVSQCSWLASAPNSDGTSFRIPVGTQYNIDLSALAVINKTPKIGAGGYVNVGVVLRFGSWGPYDVGGGVFMGSGDAYTFPPFSTYPSTQTAERASWAGANTDSLSVEIWLENGFGPAQQDFHVILQPGASITLTQAPHSSSS
jgi:hypothetical protein